MANMRDTNIDHRAPRGGRGFTLIELLIGSTLMLVVIIGTLSIYSKSNKISVDQQQYSEVQHDVRSSMYLVSRDMRMAGAALPPEFSMYALEGTNNEDQGVELTPDRLKIMGNIENPFILPIQSYSGSSVVIPVDDFSFENYPYPDDFYVNRTCIVLSNPTSIPLCADVRIITHVTHNADGTNERVNFSPGLAPGVDPPGGLSGTACDAANYAGGSILFVDINEYWLDITGSAPGLTAGVNGYIGGGVGGVLYMTKNGIHQALAQDIENLQFEYNGDFDDNGIMDGYLPWNMTWSPDQISRIRQVRVLILGRTPNRFVSVSGRPTGGIHVYRRPAVSDTSAMAEDDFHRRFLLESTSNIRNLSLNIYNAGER